MNKGAQKEGNLITAENISETARAFLKSRILLSAYELDIFTILGGGSKTWRRFPAY